MSTVNRREFMGKSLAGASIAASSYQRILGANDRISVGMIGVGGRGLMDASVWNKPWVLSGQGSTEADRIQPGAQIPPAEGPHHMKNFIECVRSRQTATNAPIEAGYSHAIATILADEALTTGKRMVYDPAKKTIHAG